MEINRLDIGCERSYKVDIKIDKCNEGDISTFAGRVTFIQYTNSKENFRKSYNYLIRARVGFSVNQGPYVIIDDSLDVELKRLDGITFLLSSEQKMEMVRILGDFQQPLRIGGAELNPGFFGIFANSSCPSSGASFPIDLTPELESIVKGIGYISN